jgi:hypothetical protein
MSSVGGTRTEPGQNRQEVGVPILESDLEAHLTF